MDWFYVHAGCAVIALIYAVWDMRPLVGRQHLFGSEILLGAVILSRLAREYTGDIAPVALYGAIDIAAVSGYFFLMLRNKALWAAVCVLLQTGMLALHFGYFIAGEIGVSAYLWALGGLHFLVFLTIIIGTMAGRHEFGRAWDDFFASRIRGFSWSGVLSTRLSAYKKKVG